MFDELIAKYGAQFGVPESWITAVMMKESSGDPNAYRPEASIHDASYGLMQLLWSTARGLGYTGAPEGLFDPETSIRLGTKLIAQLRQRFGDNAAAMYSAYNSGSGTAYLTPGPVADHVAQFSAILDTLTGAPGGGAGVLLLVALFWFWMKGGKRRK